ncbi:DUF3140 domain-containing protein [Streptomyces sp. B6B3]|uniref:DUF3140 domain-containing protein n=1 Tax=Streptomyces sp. B6B3 TaxID=3153570 RepID=UPI00325EB1D9
MRDVEELEITALWAEFHTVVNMTSQELAAWLRTSGSSESTEVRRGREVLALLYKRPTDLCDADIRLMRHVVDAVRTEHTTGPAATIPEPEWRYRLMSLGHDPLRG